MDRARVYRRVYPPQPALEGSATKVLKSKLKRNAVATEGAPYYSDDQGNQGNRHQGN